MNSKGRDTSSAEPFRVGFPHNRPGPDLTDSEFPLLNRVLPLSEKIKKAAGQRGWKTVLNAVRKCETSGERFESLPEKVKQLIFEAESQK